MLSRYYIEEPVTITHLKFVLIRNIKLFCVPNKTKKEILTTNLDFHTNIISMTKTQQHITNMIIIIY